MKKLLQKTLIIAGIVFLLVGATEGVMVINNSLRLYSTTGPIVNFGKVSSTQLTMDDANPQTMYTVPAGKTLQIHFLLQRACSVAITSSVGTFGKSGALTDYLNAENTGIGVAANSKEHAAALGVGKGVYVAGDVFQYDSTDTAAEAGSTCIFEIYGMLE
jgi:hypothetical protein